MKARAVFIDRDGVLIRDAHHLASTDGLKVFKNSAPALKLLRAAGFKVVIVTNQSGVARGYFTVAAVKRIHAELKRRLAAQGARWDALYFSPHGPGSGHPWRKPGTGMLLAAKRRFKLDLKGSWMIGDKTSDIECARRAGCGSVLVRTGKAGRDKSYKAKPGAIKKDILAAARWIAARGLLLALCLAPVSGRAAFTEKQVQGIIGLPAGAEMKVQLVYHYFKPNRDPGVVAPSWLDASLGAMLARPALQDPEEGILNEAQLWQAPVSVLYEFFELVRETFPPHHGGKRGGPALIRDRIPEHRARLDTSIKRLRAAKLGSSLGGRGKTVIAELQRIVADMKRAEGAIDAGDDKRFVSAVMSVASRASDVHAHFQK